MRSSIWRGGLVAAGLAAYAVYAYVQLDPFYAGRQFGTEGCREVKGFSGPEDFAVDTATGAIFVASLVPVTAPVLVTEGQAAGESGGVYRFRPGQAPVRLTIEGGPEVRGHGLGLWSDPSGERRLFLVDHAEAGERVVIARIEGARLVHVRTVESPLFVSLNDVAPVGPERFYVTNDHHNPRGPWQRVEDFTFQRRSNLIYFDGQEGKEVLDGLGFGNGVSYDGERLYVAESTAHRVQVLRPTAHGTVEVEAKLALGPGYDNLTILGPGHFLAASHPSAYLFLRHAADRTKPAPTRILEVELDGTRVARITELLEDDGHLYSAGSVAARLADRLYVGSVFARSILDCPATTK